MGSFTLTLDLSALYATIAPSFEILVEGTVVGSFSVNSTYSVTGYEFSYGGAYPVLHFPPV